VWFRNEANVRNVSDLIRWHTDTSLTHKRIYEIENN